MSINVTILGCGSATPTLLRNPTAQWIEIHGNCFLVDCGEGTQIQLLKYQLKMNRLKAVCISHLHGDHFFGLPGLLSSMHLMGRKNKLQIFGPEGLFKFLDDLFRLSDTILRFPLEYIQVPAEESIELADFGTFKLLSIPLNHRIACAGFLFKESPKLRKLKAEYIRFHEVPIYIRHQIKEGADYIKPDGTCIQNQLLTFDPPRSVSYAFCSDTAPFVTTVNSIKGVTALYHEATFDDDLVERAKLTFHSTASQAALQALEANVEELYLGHFSSRYNDTDRILEQAQKIFPNSIAVFDGLSFKVE
jgi:ribonuclease Z